MLLSAVIEWLKVMLTSIYTLKYNSRVLGHLRHFESRQKERIQTLFTAMRSKIAHCSGDYPEIIMKKGL